jgi:3,5-epimerase/4-reductase
MSAELFLVFGGTGFLGPRFVAYLERAGHKYVLAKTRIQNKESVEKELDEVKPTHVINIGIAFVQRFFLEIIHLCF